FAKRRRLPRCYRTLNSAKSSSARVKTTAMFPGLSFTPSRQVSTKRRRNRTSVLAPEITNCVGVGCSLHLVSSVEPKIAIARPLGLDRHSWLRHSTLRPGRTKMRNGFVVTSQFWQFLTIDTCSTLPRGRMYQLGAKHERRGRPDRPSQTHRVRRARLGAVVLG